MTSAGTVPVPEGVTLRRWLVPDPMSEKYYGICPYAYCGGDPVNLVDPDGMDWFQNTSTGELYNNPDYTIIDAGEGYMNGSSEWTFLANNDGLGKSDSELLNGATQNFYNFSEHKENGACFNTIDAASTMKSVGMEFMPTEVLAEVTEVTRNISEGELTVSYTDSSTKILSVEKSGYFPENSKQIVVSQTSIGNEIRKIEPFQCSSTTINKQLIIYDYGNNHQVNNIVKQAGIKLFKNLVPEIDRLLKKK